MNSGFQYSIRVKCYSLICAGKLNFDNFLYYYYMSLGANEIKFTPPQMDCEYQVYVPCYSYYDQYFQKLHKTLSACNILYITSTGF